MVEGRVHVGKAATALWDSRSAAKTEGAAAATARHRAIFLAETILMKRRVERGALRAVCLRQVGAQAVRKEGHTRVGTSFESTHGR
jgi:hypothetical protein